MLPEFHREEQKNTGTPENRRVKVACISKMKRLFKMSTIHITVLHRATPCFLITFSSNSKFLTIIYKALHSGPLRSLCLPSLPLCPFLALPHPCGLLVLLEQTEPVCFPECPYFFFLTHARFLHICRWFIP